MRATTPDVAGAVGRPEAPVLVPPPFRDHPLDVVVTTRAGGVSSGPYATLDLGLTVGDHPDAVVENRRRAAAAVGLDLGDLVFGRQRHGAGVAVVDAAHRGRGTTALDDALDGPDGIDALVTTTPGVGLAILVADCVPVVLYDPGAHVVAVVHAGWRGTVRRIPAAAVDAMARRGSDPADVVAYVGPAIEADRYQVGDEVAEAAREAFGDAAGEVVRPDGAGRWLFDLWGANRRTLVDAGLRPGNVSVSGVGTADRRFFSDRLARPCGRFAAIAVLHDREKA